MATRATTRDAHRLFMDGIVALADVEAAGIRIDVDYLRSAIDDVAERIAASEKTLKKNRIFKVWQKHFGAKTNLHAPAQLGHVLFKVLGYEGGYVNEETGRVKADRNAIEGIDDPFVAMHIELTKLKKLHGTYLTGLLREVGDDGIVRPFINLHTTRTFRSSSNDPNIQNQPVREEWVAEIIRRAFIAYDDDYVMVELDYGQLEVRIGEAYHHDPNMKRYLLEPGADMHRDTAADCFLLPVDQVPGPVRQEVKAGFVFSEFYGDYYASCAAHLWKAIGKYGLQDHTGRSLYEHLADEGIDRLGDCNPDKKPKRGTFEHHIKGVEDIFWGERFPVFDRWRWDIWKYYRRHGHIDFYTGFRIEGILSRNQIINAQTQGSAFHCLLWAMIRICKAIRKRRWRTRVVAQIHDSILACVHVDELDEYLALANFLMTIRIREVWPWITTPLVIDAAVSHPGGSWFDKRKVKIPT